jgi:hypothetical protein
MSNGHLKLYFFQKISGDFVRDNNTNISLRSSTVDGIESVRSHSAKRDKQALKRLRKYSYFQFDGDFHLSPV